MLAGRKFPGQEVARCAQFVLVSIVLGLGITQLLTGLSQLLQNPDKSSVYFPSFIWFFVLLVAHVQTWWTLFGLRSIENWNFVQFFVVLLQPIGLYLLSTPALPLQSNGSIEEYYFRNRKWFFTILAACLLFSLMRDLVLYGELPERRNLAFHLVLFTVSVGGICVSARRYHLVLSAVAAIGISAYIYGLFFNLT